MNPATSSRAPFPSRCALSPPWCRALHDRGFIATPAGYLKDGIFAKMVGGWVVLEASAGADLRGRRPASRGGIGLWKHTEHGGKERLLFELPADPDLGDGGEPASEAPGDLSPESFLDWALSSLVNEIPSGWQPPSADLLASWLPPGALTMHAGPLLRTGNWLLALNRWALRFPIVPLVPGDLTAQRRRWLEMLAGEVQGRWRMIRSAFVRGQAGESLIAETDLTGAPHSEFLVLASLDGLRHAVHLLAETADLLADATVALMAPEIWPPQTQTTERKSR